MDKATQLIEKYRRGECTAEERALLQKWFHQLGEHEPSSLHEQDLLAALSQFEASADRHLGNRTSRTSTGVRLSRMARSASAHWGRLAGAALILMVACAGLYHYLPNLLHPLSQVARTNPPDSVNDVAPGTNRAILTLSNGRSFQLSDADSAMIAAEAGVALTRTADGSWIYEIVDPDALKQSQVGYHTIETPRAAQHQMRLPDGTRVWLNAASSIRFPSTFSLHKERVVEITGEAYFEVARDIDRPFLVKSEGQEVRVLGTAFNVNTYQEAGATLTTLMEGRVQISKVSRSGATEDPVVLAPGQQARLTKSGFDIQQAGVQRVMDWINGDFIFQQETLVQILDRVARWYDVEIVYAADVDSVQTFSGQVSRAKHLSEVLIGLEATGQVQFDIRERQVFASR